MKLVGLVFGDLVLANGGLLCGNGLGEVGILAGDHLIGNLWLKVINLDVAEAP